MTTRTDYIAIFERNGEIVRSEYTTEADRTEDIEIAKQNGWTTTTTRTCERKPIEMFWSKTMGRFVTIPG